MFVVYLYPNDGTEMVELAVFAGETKRAKNRAFRYITERDNATDVILSAYPLGVVCVRRVYTSRESHVLRSWKVAKLAPLQERRDSASGTGSVKAFGVNSKGRVSGRVFRTNGLSDSIGALACLRKHPADASRYPIRSTDSRLVALMPDAEDMVYKANPC